MLRRDLVKAVDEVSFLLQKNNVFQALTARASKGSTSAVVATLQGVSRAEADLSVAAREVIEIFDLDDLFSADFWHVMLSNEDSEKHRDRVLSLRYAVRVAMAQLPNVARLLLRHSDEIEQAQVGEDDRSGSSGESKLTLLLPEHETLSTPKRLVLALESVEGLYHVVCILRGSNPDTLAVAACDSGSDKLFDFTGLDGVMREVKEIFLGVWDRIVLHRRNKVSGGLENIAKALPLIDEIEQRKASAVLSPEEAELLKRRVLSAVMGIQTSGAVLKEAEDSFSMINVRQLAAPSPKMLAAPVEDVGHAEGHGHEGRGDRDAGSYFDADVDMR